MSETISRAKKRDFPALFRVVRACMFGRVFHMSTNFGKRRTCPVAAASFGEFSNGTCGARPFLFSNRNLFEWCQPPAAAAAAAATAATAAAMLRSASAIAAATASIWTFSYKKDEIQQQ